EAHAILDSNLAYYVRQSSLYPEDAYNAVAIGTIHAIRSRPEEAVSWLRTAVERGWRDYRWATLEPMFESLRSRPDFRALMDDLRARLAAMRQRAQERGLLD
ncbi:MAG TPA: hypothetical protein VNL69_07305, partial [Bacteroidota bacterium]|nr:hypothetical protein [Bacteroidota bacterium]